MKTDRKNQNSQDGNARAVTLRQPKPENYRIPQTVTSPTERKEIRQYMDMRQRQIKSRLDTIYRTNKETFVEQRFKEESAKILSSKALANLIREYNKDNDAIEKLAENRDELDKHIERLCDRKQQIAEKLEDYAGKTDGIYYKGERYGNNKGRHEKHAIEPVDLLEEDSIKDKIKEEFDNMNENQMEDRNRKLAYLNEKIEERLLFGKREEIQKLFCELEKMNAIVEGEMITLGLEQPSEAWIDDLTDPSPELAEAA